MVRPGQWCLATAARQQPAQPASSISTDQELHCQFRHTEVKEQPWDICERLTLTTSMELDREQ